MEHFALWKFSEPLLQFADTSETCSEQASRLSCSRRLRGRVGNSKGRLHKAGHQVETGIGSNTSHSGSGPRKPRSPGSGSGLWLAQGSCLKVSAGWHGGKVPFVTSGVFCLLRLHL